MNTTRHALLTFGLCLIVLAISSGMASDDPPKVATLGEPAPDFTLKDVKGQEHTLASLHGKIVVLEWTNQECPYVDRHYRTKSMQQTYEKVKELDTSAVWLAIDSTHTTNGKQVEFWINQHKIPYPVLLDPDSTVGRLYDARTTPHMFVIDREGKLRYHGAIDDNQLATKQGDQITNYVLGAVKQIVSGETVAPSFVKPYGCRVKFKP